MRVASYFFFSICVIGCSLEPQLSDLSWTVKVTQNPNESPERPPIMDANSTSLTDAQCLTLSQTMGGFQGGPQQLFTKLLTVAPNATYEFQIGSRTE